MLSSLGAGASVAVVSLGLMLLHPGTGSAQHASVRVAAQTANARAIFLADCAVCHGGNAQGSDRGPALGPFGRAGVDYSLSTGRMPLAPAGRTDEAGRPIEPLPQRQLPKPDLPVTRHDPAYSPTTIQALVDYIASLTGEVQPDIPRVQPGDLTRGGTLYRLQCAACHAWAGDGGALLHREAPSLHQATDLQVAEAVRVGPGQMPAFGTAALTDEQLDAVVTYVKYLQDPDDRGGTPLAHLGPFAEGALGLAALGALLLLTRWIGQRG